MDPHGEANEADLLIETENQQQVIPDFVIDTLARCLFPKAQAYFASPEGQKAFAAWKEQQDKP